MNNLKIIADEMLPVYENEHGERFINARELHEKLMVGKDFSTWIKLRIEQYDFTEDEDFSPILGNSAKSTFGANVGRQRKDYLFTLDAGKELAMVENNEMGRAIRKYFIEVEKRFRQKQPQSIEDLIIMQAQSMKELREKQAKIEQQNTLLIEQQNTLKHRVDNLDRIDTIGDLQQRLNGMIRRYAQQEGVNFSKAWKEFRNAYNTAFNTNLTAKINNYIDKHGLKSLTAPQYFSLTNGLEDAVRVADKMLNNKEEAQCHLG
ncbi:antA/AntB antirepressor family protein [Bacillus sp. BRMEA1]|uniref:antA/AntB antirepressor family protein n=1 Tax=Neobacillus endophyticus TaxID=2738405 RepID=UPI001563A215|nr:antA/AntB antirepressor family protein [Neobacillus endophyticus]NRD80324.1 antA/AntB antirepressor family protein [Neobacillus endophyticus]